MRRLDSVAILAATMLVVLFCIAATASASEYGALAWGLSSSNQLGNGSKGDSSTPVTVGELKGVIAVAAGKNHSLALLSNHTVLAWGSNSFGQLGTGNQSGHGTPVVVPGLTNVVAIAAGGEYSLALLENGEVKAWGRNSRGQLGVGSKTGPSKCGSGKVGETEAEEEERACALSPTKVGALSGATAIAAGGSHALALLKGGTVEAWGDNQNGQLGIGTSTGPEKCGAGAAAEACSRKPVAVSELTGVTAVAAGGAHSLALLEGGTVQAWGSNQFGQLGNGTFTGPNKCKTAFEGSTEVACGLSPAEVVHLSEVTAIAAGGKHSLAISNGMVYGWGANASGQLGDGKTFNEDEPVKMIGLTEVVAIAAGGQYSEALLSNDTLKATGNNEHGQLGDGTFTGRISPVNSGPGEIFGVSAGEAHTLVFGAPGAMVTKVTPSSGSSKGGTRVVIEGSGFTEPLTVTFGGNEAVGVTVDSETMIEATTPVMKPGKQPVIVKTRRSSSANVTGAKFTAEPSSIEIGRCIRLGAEKGKFKNPGCTEEVAGSIFEWEPGFLKGGFTGAIKEATTTVLESAGGSKVSCSGETATGEWQTPGSATNVAVTLSGCTFGLGTKCSSAGAAEGEIVSSSLEGAIGFTEQPTNKVGIDLFPEGEEETLFDATCGASRVRIKGAVIGMVATVNKMNIAFTVKFKQSKGRQLLEGFEGGPTETLEMSVNEGAFERAGWDLETILTNEERLEINTVV